MSLFTAEEQKVLFHAATIIESKIIHADAMVNAEMTKQFFQLHLVAKEHEVSAVMFLTAQHKLITFEQMFRGTVDSCSVQPREIVKAALKHNAVAIILGHNHPSGEPEPSAADSHITQLVRNACKLVDVRVLDHNVVGTEGTVSMAQRGLI